MERRDFLTLASGAFIVSGLAPEPNAAPARPNILWITCEDMSPDMGCYGNTEVRTPILDRLASQGARYTHAFGHAGVCAPVRSGIITGMYPSSIGSNHMRTANSSGTYDYYPDTLPRYGYEAVPPPYVKCFTEYLRAAGYYCTNRTKTDYQFEPPITAWDHIIPFNEGGADWRGREPGQPFFCVINFTITHESQIRMPEGKKSSRDLSNITVAPYYPDTPLVRNDYACYYDNIETLDTLAGEVLEWLADDGLERDTVVFFYGDHGRGLPRGKRWLYDSGLQFPLLVKWPGVIEPGTESDELVSFIDLGPTALSIAGIPLPPYFQGQAFLGGQKAPARPFIFAARDRMDTAYDRIRAVRDHRYKYIRNFEPEKPYAQTIVYRDLMPTMQEMRRLAAVGKLEGPAALFMATRKPPEEFYDTLTDPYEIDNRAGDPAYRGIIDRMREELNRWMWETGDLGEVPESDLVEHFRPGGMQPVTAPPVIEETTPGSSRRITITCPTDGASIAWTADAGDNPHWLLYHEPLALPPGTRIRARAIRIGFKESTEVSITIA